MVKSHGEGLYSPGAAFTCVDPTGEPLKSAVVETMSLLPTGRVSVESPFPYAEHMRVAVLKTDADQVVPETAAVIADLARALGGRTLGLFTSLRRMNQVAELLDQELRGEGFEILAPRRASDDPAALVQRFTRVRGGAILLGARTFWQNSSLRPLGITAQLGRPIRSLACVREY